MSEEIVRVELPTLSAHSVDVLLAFQASLMELDNLRQSLAEQGDWPSLAAGLANLTELKNQLTVVMQAIEHDIYYLMPEKKQMIDGVGTFEKRRSNSKKWESEKLLRDIVRSRLFNEDGEVAPGTMALIETLEKVLPLTASLGWRATALKEQGFDPAEYSDVTWGRETISIQR